MIIIIIMDKVKTPFNYIVLTIMMIIIIITITIIIIPFNSLIFVSTATRPITDTAHNNSVQFNSCLFTCKLNSPRPIIIIIIIINELGC
jgi:hypothetical protein